MIHEPRPHSLKCIIYGFIFLLAVLYNISRKKYKRSNALATKKDLIIAAIAVDIFILIVIIGFSYLDLGIDLEKIENVKIVPEAYSVHSAPVSSKPNAADRETIYVHCRFEDGGYPDFYVESYSLYGHEGLSYIQEQIDEKNSIRVNAFYNINNYEVVGVSRKSASVLSLYYENESIFRIGIWGIVFNSILFGGIIIYMQFSNMFKKKTTDVTFEKVKYNQNRTLENNYDGLIDSPSWEQVVAYLEKITVVDDEFLTLTLSEAVYGVRYIQACKVGDKYSVQLGIEKEDSTNLVEAYYDFEDMKKIFYDFYSYGYVENIELYKPVSFIV